MTHVHAKGNHADVLVLQLNDAPLLSANTLYVTPDVIAKGVNNVATSQENVPVASNAQASVNICTLVAVDNDVLVTDVMLQL